MGTAITKPRSIFDFLNDICYHKTKWNDIPESDKKKFQPYMITRWLSMHPDYLEIVADVQMITSRLEPKEFYIFFSDLLPKKKFFTKYIKSSGSDDSKDRLIQFVAEKCKLSEADAEDVIDLASIDDLKLWLSGYGFSEREIKKQLSV